MLSVLAEYGFPVGGIALMVCGLLLAKKHAGWSMASMVGGSWLLALWVFVDQGSL